VGVCTTTVVPADCYASTGCPALRGYSVTSFPQHDNHPGLATARTAHDATKLSCIYRCPMHVPPLLVLSVRSGQRVSFQITPFRIAL
jgi:hypothetical protein